MSWYVFNFADILFYAGLGWAFWFVGDGINKDPKMNSSGKPWFNSYALGLAVTFLAWFSVGILCGLSAALYVGFVYLWEKIKQFALWKHGDKK